VLLSFGLLSPNKGIEYVIEALPEIVAHCPKRRIRRPWRDAPARKATGRRILSPHAATIGAGRRAWNGHVYVSTIDS